VVLFGYQGNEQEKLNTGKLFLMRYNNMTFCTIMLVIAVQDLRLAFVSCKDGGWDSGCVDVIMVCISAISVSSCPKYRTSVQNDWGFTYRIYAYA